MEIPTDAVGAARSDDLVLGAADPAAEGVLYPRSKRALDVAVATALLVATLPVFVTIAAIVRRDGGSILFAQRRVGAGGEVFLLRKFRSMAVDAEERLLADPELHARYVENGFKLPAGQDPRITPVGRFLRSTSLDELPQLINVLRGDMSMVGPRPIVEPELDEYSRRGAGWVYLASRPGLTGLWQVSGRSAVGYDERVALDIAYHQHRSLLGDVRIIGRTALAVLRRVGAH